MHKTLGANLRDGLLTSPEGRDVYAESPRGSRDIYARTTFWTNRAGRLFGRTRDLRRCSEKWALCHPCHPASTAQAWRVRQQIALGGITRPVLLSARDHVLAMVARASHRHCASAGVYAVAG